MSQRTLPSKLDLAAVVMIAAVLSLAGAAAASSRGWNIPGDAGFWGSIVGAIIGGAIALAGQWFTILDVRQSRKDEKAAQDRACGTAFLLKLVKVYNHLSDVDRFLSDIFAKDRERREQGGAGEPWMFFQPAAHLSGPIFFSAGELAVLVSNASDELITKCVMLDEKHNSTLAHLAKAGELRIALVATLEPDEVRGNVFSGSVHLSARQRAEMNQINLLLLEIRTANEEDLRNAGRAMSEVSTLFREKLGTTIAAMPAGAAK